MGLPTIDIIFKTLAISAVTRSMRGVVALVLHDTKVGVTTYKGIEEVLDSHYSATNVKHVKEAFYAAPYRVIVVAIAAESPVSDALNQLKGMYFNYLAVPEATAAEVTDIATFIKSQRANNKKGFKAVLANSASDDEGIINFTTAGITLKDGTTMTTGAFTARLASVFATLPFTRSATYYAFSDVASITEIDDANETINAGELILVNDGRKVKIGRAVNSLVTFTADKSKDFSKIRIVEILDMIREDVRSTFEDEYVGKFPNSYVYKRLFATSVTAYFATMAIENALEREAVNRASISVEQQRLYLQSIGNNTDNMKEADILRANTGSNVFLDANISVLDAMEDLKFVISM